MVPFLVIILVVILSGSILGIIAFSAAQRLDSTLKSIPFDQLMSRLSKLEQKLAQLEKLASGAPPAAPSTVISPAPPPPVQAPKAPVPPAPGTPLQPSPTVRPREIPPSPPAILSPIPKEPSAADLESLIGGRWFNRIGIIALLFAVSYFLKLAFDNNWIGPAGRVAIGIFLGALMLPWSQWLLSRGYSYFSDGIAGLGEATLFVSVWAGCQYYTLFSRQTGFAALVVVTAVMAFLALRRDSQPIAFLSLVGGLLTPALMSRGENQQVMLFSYLLILGGAALVICWRKEWYSLLPLAFVTTQLYFWQWYDSFYIRAQFLERTALFACLFFLLYSVIPTLRAFRQLELSFLELLLVAANAIALVSALYVMLWPEDRWPLTLFFLVLAAVHLGIAAILPGSDSTRYVLPRFLYLGLAVTFLTLAIPTRFDGNTIMLAFAVEGGALAWIGFRSHGGLLRPAGYFLLALAAFRLFFKPPDAGTFLWNERFASYLVLIAGIAAPLWAAMSFDLSSRAKRPDSLLRAEVGRAGLQSRGISPQSQSALGPDSGALSESAEAEISMLSIFTNFFALLALSLEFWDYFGRGISASDHSLAQQLSLSILWTCYAAGLLVFGILRRSALLRWQALILLFIVVAKVFLIDLSSLDRVYRILSFFILGSALLAVSFLYQRKQARDRSHS